MAACRIVAVAVDGSLHSDNALNCIYSGQQRSPPDYLDRVQLTGDKLLLIHIPEEYNFTDAKNHRGIPMEAYYANLLFLYTYEADFIQKTIQRQKQYRDPAVIEELLRKMKEKGDEVERKYTDQLKDLNVEFTFKQGFGKPGEQIVSIAENEKASLLMIGSRGHGWLVRTILGSVSNYVIHHTSIPVLICKDYEKMK